MKNLDRNPKSRTERALILVSLLGFLLTGVFLASEDLYQSLIGFSSDSSNQPVIGSITQSQNDVRARSSQSTTWRGAKTGREIQLGDSVFTGPRSSAEVTLQTGDRIVLNENSLVKFSNLDKIEMPNLALGNLRLSVSKTMKVAIGGQIAEIRGQGSELEFTLTERQQPKIKVIKGSAEVRTKDSTQKIVAPSSAHADALTVAKAPAEFSLSGEFAPPEPAPQRPARAKLNPMTEPLIYTQELHDLYETDGDQLVPRTKPRRMINFPLPVSWREEENPEQVFGQLSSNTRFSVVPASFVVAGGTRVGTFPQSFAGTNFVRLSADGKTWSDPIKIQVVTQPLPTPAPDLRLKSHILYILDNAAEIEGQILSDLPRFVMEVSENPEFPASETRVGWKNNREVQFLVSQPKTLYMRVRGVDENMKVTNPSSVARVEVSKPQPPEPPRLSQSEIRAVEGDSVQLRWPAAAQAQSYKVKIVSANGKIVTEQIVDSAQLIFQAQAVGSYKIELVSRDSFGRSSRGSGQARLIVEARPQPAEQSRAPAALAQEESDRAREAGQITTTAHSTSVPRYLNRKFNSSRFSIEGAIFSTFSLDQLDQGQQYPTPATLGVRTLTWFGSKGVEGSFKSKTIDLFGTAKGASSPLQAEARIHHRWQLPFNPFISLNQSQVSIIAGYEYYRNYGNGLFSPRYELLKTGFSLAFPLLTRFDTGGEVLYGYGFDASQKYEVAGFINYYYKRNWSLGVGYRVHLFQAGSAGVTPLGLPYREGFGEGNSVLQWHY